MTQKISIPFSSVRCLYDRKNIQCSTLVHWVNYSSIHNDKHRLVCKEGKFIIARTKITTTPTPTSIIPKSLETVYRFYFLTSKVMIKPDKQEFTWSHPVAPKVTAWFLLGRHICLLIFFLFFLFIFIFTENFRYLMNPSAPLFWWYVCVCCFFFVQIQTTTSITLYIKHKVYVLNSFFSHTNAHTDWNLFA